MNWNTLPKPAEYAENQIINAILEGHFPIGAALPAERELAARLGVTRPTLREALQRLAREGWLEIHQGKPTRVRNYWYEGSLGVLSAIAQRPWAAPDDFIANLLAVRRALAPAYARQAVERQASAVVDLLEPYLSLPQTKKSSPDDSEAASKYASFDWQVHHTLTVLSGNPIYTMIFNGFRELYPPMAMQYFRSSTARASSRSFYASLSSAAQAANPDIAEAVTRRAMTVSISLWRAAMTELHNTKRTVREG